jgi:carbon dioxide concentrating mechanism protein CcmN
MRSPSLVIINDSHLFVSGEVVIHPTAAIASGVLLQADPGCKVVIEAGVCVGSGSILHANQGDLVLESGVILGSGVLIVGSSTIGENACVGSLTTILGCSVEARQFIPAESLLGDRSRQIELAAEPATIPAPLSAQKPPDRNGGAANAGVTNPYTYPYAELESPWSSKLPSPPQPPVPAPSDRNGSQPEPQPAASTASTPQPPVQQVVYGRTYLEKMMIRMFPHRQALDSSSDPDSS